MFVNVVVGIAMGLKRKSEDIKKIIIHCSDSNFGDSNIINQWHLKRGWSGIGYHYVITNGVINSGDKYHVSKDGIVQGGRSIEKKGAHCKGENHDSIGICLIGKHNFSARQLIESLPFLLKKLMLKYSIGIESVYTHNSFSPKTCPNFSQTQLKELINGLV